MKAIHATNKPDKGNCGNTLSRHVSAVTYRMKTKNVTAQNSAQSSTVKAKGKALKPILSTVIMVVSGIRGLAARLGQLATTGKGKDQTVKFRALQDNKGLALKDGQWVSIIGGKLSGKKERQGQLECGGYVNGRLTGADARFFTPAQFRAIAKPCLIHWQADKDPVSGFYIGDPNVKGMCAVFVPAWNYYWQVELDSNANNKHERAKLAPVKKGGKLVKVAC